MKARSSASPPAAAESGLLMYQLVSLAGLGLILLPQVARGVGLLELCVAVAGLLGLLTRWRLAPFAVLGLVAVSQAARPYIWGVYSLGQDPNALRPADLLVCCGVVAYVGAHYRLRGLTSHILPPDPRLRPGERRPGLLGRWWQKPARHARPARQVTPGELALFLLTLPLWAALAQVVWGWLARARRLLGLPASLSRFILLAWALAVGGLLVASLLGQWRLRSMTRTEAELLLQDALWRETRGEQRRLQRWLTWSRLRRGRRKETS